MAPDTLFIDDNASFLNMSPARAFHCDDLIGDGNDVRGEVLCSATRRADLDEDDESDLDEDSVEDDEEEDDDEYDDDEEDEEDEEEEDDVDDEIRLIR